MADEGAAAAIAEAATAALQNVAGLGGVADGVPIAGGDAQAVVEIGPETDWGHKSGAGAEVRLAVLIRCGGERPARARALSSAARAAMAAIGPQLGGPPGSGPGKWRLVNLTVLRARVLAAAGGGARNRAGPGWTAVVEYRARMLREEG